MPAFGARCRDLLPARLLGSFRGVSTDNATEAPRSEQLAEIGIETQLAGIRRREIDPVRAEQRFEPLLPKLILDLGGDQSEIDVPVSPACPAVVHEPERAGGIGEQVREGGVAMDDNDILGPGRCRD